MPPDASDNAHCSSCFQSIALIFGTEPRRPQQPEPRLARRHSDGKERHEAAAALSSTSPPGVAFISSRERGSEKLRLLHGVQPSSSDARQGAGRVDEEQSQREGTSQQPWQQSSQQDPGHEPQAEKRPSSIQPDSGTATCSTSTNNSQLSAAMAGLNKKPPAHTRTPSIAASVSGASATKPVLVEQDEDDDFCPTCLETYTTDNPKVFTSCAHHFHMQCIYEWLERKDTCPMCESKMSFPGFS